MSSSSLYLVGGNLVVDSELRKKLAGRDASVELQMVVEDIFKGWEGGEMKDGIEETIKKTDKEKIETYDRSQLKITLKVFLREYSVEALVAGVEAALTNLNTDHVDTLFLPVPADAVPIIGIGSDTTGADQSSALTSLEEVWREVEKLVKAGKVGGAGLCDLRPSVFIQLYNQAEIKPTSIQVNLKTCCVVPEELSEFAKLNKVTLLTHSDPEELLPEDSLRKLLYPHLKREAGHYSPTWISRYLVQLKDRGVLLEKRYILKLLK